jgi:hypothetical protein
MKGGVGIGDVAPRTWADQLPRPSRKATTQKRAAGSRTLYKMLIELFDEPGSLRGTPNELADEKARAHGRSKSVFGKLECRWSSGYVLADHWLM